MGGSSLFLRSDPPKVARLSFPLGSPLHPARGSLKQTHPSSRACEIQAWLFFPVFWGALGTQPGVSWGVFHGSNRTLGELCSGRGVLGPTESAHGPWRPRAKTKKSEVWSWGSKPWSWTEEFIQTLLVLEIEGEVRLFFGLLVSLDQ